MGDEVKLIKLQTAVNAGRYSVGGTVIKSIRTSDGGGRTLLRERYDQANRRRQRVDNVETLPRCDSIIESINASDGGAPSTTP